MKPRYFTAQAIIGGRRYIVGHYLARSQQEALKAAKADILAMIGLEVGPETTADLPYVAQLQAAGQV